ncbi:MAG: shikimate dehydrogenase [Bacteroidales bacterium]|jgi:shikimate dehydrogenase|nr:shikimate dehydrogenase [Bacteroidales bacterium]
MKIFGLIGKKLDHSFSPQYFRKKFINENIKDADYQLFPLNQLEDFRLLLQDNPEIAGLNVTIPYKTDIIPWLDELSPAARAIGAVNTIKFKFLTNGLQLSGYNTDYLGFAESLKPHLKAWHTKALILGTGGSSKAVIYALKQMKLDCQMVSREPKNKDHLDYSMLSGDLIADYKVIINTTPVGMYPDVEQKPRIDYSSLTQQHILFDLIYNPGKTNFLLEGEKRGCRIINGLEMLKIQADYSWKIWND